MQLSAFHALLCSVDDNQLLERFRMVCKLLSQDSDSRLSLRLRVIFRLNLSPHSDPGAESVAYSDSDPN